MTDLELIVPTNMGDSIDFKKLSSDDIYFMNIVLKFLGLNEENLRDKDVLYSVKKIVDIIYLNPDTVHEIKRLIGIELPGQEEETIEYLTDIISIITNNDYDRYRLNTRNKVQKNRESGILQEIPENAPAIIYQPQSAWLPPKSSNWGPDQKSVMLELSKLHRKAETVVLPKKKRIQEWKIICNQLGEFRKDELIQLAWEMDIGVYIRPNWTKAKICEVISKHMAVL